MLVPPQAIQNSLGPRIRSGGRLRMSRTVTAPITIWAPTRTAPTARGRQSRCFRRRSLAIALRQDDGWVGPQDLPSHDREAQSKAFATFAAVVMAAYDAYLAAGPRDLVRDGVSYSMNAFWLSDEEHLEFLRDLSDVIAPRAGNAPGRRRRRRLAASALLAGAVPR